MSLGENIYHLRTEKRMSQGDLAEVLGVSRQSISKWETDSSTPELEKLLKLSALFGVSLDELVNGVQRSLTPTAEATEQYHREEAAPPTYTPPRRWPARKFVGVVLLGLALLLLCFGVLLGEAAAGTVLAVPLVICGVICFAVQRFPGLWCGWMLQMLLDGFLRFATAGHYSTVLARFRIVGWGMLMKLGLTELLAAGQLLLIVLLFVATLRCFCKDVLHLSKKGLVGLVTAWAVYLLSYGIIPMALTWVFDAGVPNVLYMLIYALQIPRAVVFTVLLTATICVVRGRNSSLCEGAVSEAD